MKIIGVLLDGYNNENGTVLCWKKIESGYVLGSNESDVVNSFEMNFKDLPTERRDHDLFSWASSDGSIRWVNTFGMTKAQRLSATDLMSSTGKILQAHLVAAFADDEPVLILFGRDNAAFNQSEIQDVFDEGTYNQKIRPFLFPSLQVGAEIHDDGTAIVRAQLFEIDGTVSTRSGVTLYWEATGGYFVAARTDTVDGVAVAVLKDFGHGVKVKVGFKNYPAKAEVLL